MSVAAAVAILKVACLGKGSEFACQGAEIAEGANFAPRFHGHNQLSSAPADGSAENFVHPAFGGVS